MGVRGRAGERRRDCAPMGADGPDGPFGLSAGIAAQPHKEGRIVSTRLAESQQNMQANLDRIRSQVQR